VSCYQAYPLIVLNICVIILCIIGESGFNFFAAHLKHKSLQLHVFNDNISI